LYAFKENHDIHAYSAYNCQPHCLNLLCLIMFIVVLYQLQTEGVPVGCDELVKVCLI
jgi:hypothetical protein